MKSAIFAVALAIGGTAFAQGTPTATPTNDPVVRTNVSDGSAPERDARGIPVVSAPATVPAGANQAPPAGAGQVVPAPNQQQVFTPQASTEQYPPCSRTVTDNCVQAYERGRGPR